MARALARAGVAVATVDRVGLGETEPQRHGALIDPDEQVAAIHAVVGGFHSGKSASDQDCARPPVFSRIVLGGHSYAGFLAMFYATRFSDFDGLVPMAFSPWETSDEYTDAFVRCQAQSRAGPDGRMFPFCPGNDGVSEDCIRFVFFQKGVDPSGAEARCANENLREPVGTLAAAGRFEGLKAPPASVRGKPVLMLFAEFDALVNDDFGQNRENEERLPEAWNADCACDLTTFRQLQSGHNFLLHRTYPSSNAAFVAWLRQNDFAPMVPATPDLVRAGPDASALEVDHFDRPSGHSHLFAAPGPAGV